MKKTIRGFIVIFLISLGLILALPFSTLRTSFNTVIAKYSDKTFVDISGRVDKMKNKKIAKTVTTILESNTTTVDNSTNYAGIKSQIQQKDEKNAVSYLPYITVNSDYNALKPNGSDEIVRTGNLNKDNISSNNPSINISLIPTKKGSSIDVNGTSVMAMSKDMTTTKAATSSTKQAGPGLPPPGEGGTPPSLPIGDGSMYLLVLASLFGLLKLRKTVLI